MGSWGISASSSPAHGDPAGLPTRLPCTNSAPPCLTHATHAANATPLVARLNRTAVARLAGRKSLEAIAPFAHDHGRPCRLAQGFTRLDAPGKATRCPRGHALDIDAYEHARAAGLAARCPDGGDTPALDGKSRRGRGGYQVPGILLLSA